MTQKEIEAFLVNTKVYVAGKSKEIQEKLLSFGYRWLMNGRKVTNTDKPFILIDSDKIMTYSEDMEYFSNHNYAEVSATNILSLELTEPDYRPFNNREECWREMLKHKPFGWLKNVDDGDYYPVGNVYNEMDFKDWLRIYKFADGTPFGIKEE